MASISVAILIKSGFNVQDAVNKVVRDITEKFGKGNVGLLALDDKGNVASAFNTEVMGRAWSREGMDKVIVAHFPSDKFP